jgi:excisionase family DNA binding protein
MEQVVELVTADKVAKVLRVSRQRVYELVRKGYFPRGVVVLLGERQIRFDEEALRAWIRGGCKQEAPEGVQAEEPARSAA